MSIANLIIDNDHSTSALIVERILINGEYHGSIFFRKDNTMCLVFWRNNDRLEFEVNYSNIKEILLLCFKNNIPITTSECFKRLFKVLKENK